jgi:hypothetical protein
MTPEIVGISLNIIRLFEEPQICGKALLMYPSWPYDFASADSLSPISNSLALYLLVGYLLVTHRTRSVLNVRMISH